MRFHSTADVPGIAATVRQEPADTRCSEVLRRQPGGSGKYFWLLVEQRGIALRQVVAALARAAKVDQALIAHGGPRDRRALVEQWYSIPVEAVDQPKALRGAGYKSQLTVRKVLPGKQAMGPDQVSHLAWQCRLEGAGTPAAYQAARQVIDSLRRQGMPNLLPAAMLGPGRQWAKWGRMLTQGKRLPPSADTFKPGRLLAAYQADLFNHLVAWRWQQPGGCHQPQPGDVLRTNLTAAPERWQEMTVAPDQPDVDVLVRRLAGFEAGIVGSLVGRDSHLAAWELAWYQQQGIDPTSLARARGGQRLLRVQPTKTLVDLHRGDLLVSCHLPPEAAVTVLLDELVKPEQAVQ